MLKFKSDQIKIDYSSLEVEITLRSSLATLSLTQHFHNPSSSPAEVTYSIPLHPSSVLTGLRAIFSDETTLELKVMEKEQAQENFQDKLSQGHLPIMAQKEKNLLNVYIGHLPAGQSIKIITNFAFPLISKENFWKFEMPEGITLNPSLKYKVLLSVPSDIPIQEYHSNWDFDYKVDHHSLSGTYCSSNKPFIQDRLEFSYKTTENIEPKLIIQSNGRDYAAMLSFIPYCKDSETLEDYESSGEFLFIIDRSGSMSGQRINLAKNAATLFLKSLSKSSTFNIVSFGSTFKLLYPEPVLANSLNVSGAISKISEFSADMGGTEIYKPLEVIYKKNIEPGVKRFIFLLTDGDVSSPQQVVDLIEKNQDKGKVFSFGIEDANEFLVRETAIKGNGESYYIKKAADIGKNVIRALTICVSPFVENVKVDLGWDFAPKLESIKWVNYGCRFCVFALGSHVPDGPCALTCFDSFKHLELRFEIHSREIMAGDELFKLWAKYRIDDDPDNCLEPSLQYQVISPKTCYFASRTNPSGLNEEILPGKISSNLPISSSSPSSSGGFIRKYQSKNSKRPITSCRMGSSSSSNSGSPLMIKSHQPKNAIRACRKQSSSSSGDEDEESPMDALYSTYLAEKMKIDNARADESRKLKFVLTGVYSDSNESNKLSKRLNFERAKESSSSSSSEALSPKKLEVCSVKASEAPVERQLTETKEKECSSLNDRNEPLAADKKRVAVTFLDIVICQDSEGFWDWKAVLDLVDVKEALIEFGRLFDDLRVAGTCLALAYLTKNFPDSKEEWILVERKATKWLRNTYQEYVAGIKSFKELL